MCIQLITTQYIVHTVITWFGKICFVFCCKMGTFNLSPREYIVHKVIPYLIKNVLYSIAKWVHSTDYQLSYHRSVVHFLVKCVHRSDHQRMQLMIVSTDKSHPHLCANLSFSKLFGKSWKPYCISDLLNHLFVKNDKSHPHLCANLSSSKLIGKLWKKCMYLPSFQPCIFEVGIMRIWKKSHIETIPLPYHTQQTEIRIVGLLMIRYSPRCFTFLVNHIK